ncbi:MAG: TRAP transporter permease [Deltaproteobacteria bacterium]|nr:MAG: TRAP transporter permease [Deltaproteobacteria bacterium]
MSEERRVISAKGNPGSIISEDAIEEARRIAEEEETGYRHPGGWQKYIIPAVAIGWCIFQLSIASWLLMNSVYVRAIHLGFAMLLAYFCFPAKKKPVKGFFSFLSERERIPTIDLVLAVVACLAALYLWLDYEGVMSRYGALLTRDIVIGAILVILLLEAARRVVGPALSVIAALFTVYVFFAEHMPEAFAFKSASLAKYVDKIALSTEGIYGIPLDVSASVVFLFVLFGAMLEKAGAGKFFIELALSLLGRFKGGPAKAAIVGSGLTGLVSGSSIANIVTTGTFTIPLMKKVGYPPTKAAAIEVAASTDGQIAPPIMGAAAFIIAEYLSVPYLDVVKAAAIPAFVSYATLFFIAHVEATKLGLRGLSPEETPRFLEVLKGGVQYLIPIGVLVYELVVPRHSPELAAFRAIVVLFFVMIIQHPVGRWRRGEPVLPGFRQGFDDVVRAMVSGGRNMVTVAIATAAAGIIVGVVTMGIGGIITEVVEYLSGGNIFALVAITAIASLILGMGLPTTATYIVMAALTAPIIVEVGAANGFIVPLMAAHLFCFYFGILADDTPPVGLAAYAASAIAKSPPIPTGIQGFLYDIRTAMIAFMFIFNHDLILDGVNSWGLAGLIFASACIGNFCFAAATQGWFVTKNKFYEVPLFLAVTYIMMQPHRTAKYLGLPNFYAAWGLGLFIFVLIYVNQVRRKKGEVPVHA